jgi:glycosyltransferase involved in cell wall biosynthesis
MRILWMKPILPYPPTQGTRRVTLQLLQNLAGEHTIRLFARRLRKAERADVAALEREVTGLDVVAPLAPNRTSSLHRAVYRVRARAAVRRGIPPVETYTALPALVDAFGREAERFRPELVVVEYWYSFPYLERVRGVPAVLFAHDIEYLARERAGLLRRGPQLRVDHSGGGCERGRLAGAPAVWFLTEGDRAEAVRNAGVSADRSAVIPYGLDLDVALAARRAGDPPEIAERVLFFGSFAADFNRDALEYTLTDLWPRIVQGRPGASLLVAGGGLPPGLARRARDAGAEILGEVEDVRALLLAAAVVLVPLRYGGGLRIRLLESLALERAVVGSPVGVLGMGPEAGREVLTGDDSESLAGAVVRALSDPDLRALAAGAGGRRGHGRRQPRVPSGAVHRVALGRRQSLDAPGLASIDARSNGDKLDYLCCP